MELTLPVELDLNYLHLTDDQFFQICADNPELNIELNAKGVLLIIQSN
jgi:Uma2 family endonuclease